MGQLDAEPIQDNIFLKDVGVNTDKIKYRQKRRKSYIESSDSDDRFPYEPSIISLPTIEARYLSSSLTKNNKSKRENIDLNSAQEMQSPAVKSVSDYKISTSKNENISDIKSIVSDGSNSLFPFEPSMTSLPLAINKEGVLKTKYYNNSQSSSSQSFINSSESSEIEEIETNTNEQYKIVGKTMAHLSKFQRTFVKKSLLGRNKINGCYKKICEKFSRPAKENICSLKNLRESIKNNPNIKPGFKECNCSKHTVRISDSVSYRSDTVSITNLKKN